MQPRTAAHLDRIGMGAGTPEPDADGLARLHEAHLRSVPFENLSIHLGEPILLDTGALFDKVVTRRRGGFCYELNGLLAALLRDLGFEVTLLAARVWAGGTLGLPFDHLALRVDCPDPWLVDVGFGAHSLHPLRLDEAGDQRDPAGTFRIVAAGDGDVDVVKDGAPQYRVEPRPRHLGDFEGMCWWHQTSPRSHFTGNLVCSLQTAGGRITLSGDRLIRLEAGRRTEVELAGDTEVLGAYREHFGIGLAQPPRLRGR